MKEHEVQEQWALLNELEFDQSRSFQYLHYPFKEEKTQADLFHSFDQLLSLWQQRCQLTWWCGPGACKEHSIRHYQIYWQCQC